MIPFTECKANKQLETLAKQAIDLAREKQLSPKRIREFKKEAAGLTLFYGTERITEEVMSALFFLAGERQAVTQMREMQEGSLINKIEGFPSENRSVLHTAMRDFFDQRIETPVAKEAATLAYKELEKLRDFLELVERKGFTDFIQIGIGGSELGPKAIYLALEAFKKEERKVHFISNVDPDDISSVLRHIDLRKTLVAVVSKSGTTLETLTNEAIVRKKFIEEGLSPQQHFVAVTGEGSPMDNAEKYCASFYIWDYVGGRYSATSMVGSLLLAFALGMEKLLEFLRGANTMDKVALREDPESNLPLFSALLGIWNHNFLHHPTCAIIPYSQALSRFPAHLQQLDMESNGKSIDKMGRKVDFWTGPIIWGEIGTNGQHSFYQLLHQGSYPVPIEFIGFFEPQYSLGTEFEGTSSQEKLLSNLFAQSIALATGQMDDNPNKIFPGNRPNRILFAKKCDPYTMGAILSYYEHKVAFQGFLWGINSFDQEGVQLGKVLANEMISLFKKKKEGIQIDGKSFPLGSAYLEQIEMF